MQVCLTQWRLRKSISSIILFKVQSKVQIPSMPHSLSCGNFHFSLENKEKNHWKPNVQVDIVTSIIHSLAYE